MTLSSGSLSKLKLTSLFGRPWYRPAKADQCAAHVSRIFGITPDRLRLGGLGHRVARGPVEVDLNVNAVLLAEFDGLVDLLEDRLLEIARFGAIGPAAVIQRQAHKVEPELGDVGEVALVEGLLFV